MMATEAPGIPPCRKASASLASRAARVAGAGPSSCAGTGAATVSQTPAAIKKVILRMTKLLSSPGTLVGSPGVWAEVLVEPGHGAADEVLAVVGLPDRVPFAGIDHELRRDSQGLQGVPELVGLRDRTLDVPLSHQDERRGLDLLDERDRRAAGVDFRVVVHRGAEVRDHPLIDAVLPIIALPVRDPGSGDRGAEAAGLGHRPHRHVAAIAPAGDADALGIDRQGLQDLVDAGQDVPQVAVPEVLDVGPRERLSPSQAAV